MKQLYPFQKYGAEWLAKKTHALLADEMGLGKTVQAIAACNIEGLKKILILCPASLKLNWRNELRDWYKLGGKIFIVNGGGAEIPAEATIVICNYDIIFYPLILKQLTHRHFEVCIMDEVHKLKNMEAKRTRAVLGQFGVAKQCGRRWCITGTPLLNRPSEFYPMFKTLAPEIIQPYMSFEDYGEYYCGGYYDDYGVFQARGATHIEELASKLRASGFILRRLKSSVAKDLPSKTIQCIKLEPTAAINLVYTKANNDAKKAKPFSQYEELGRMTLERKDVAEAKLDLCWDIIRDTLAETEKLVIFAHHHVVIDRLMRDLLEFHPVCLTGATSTTQRQEVVDRFQNDKNVKVFIGQIQSAGVGITLTAASHVIFVEGSWTPGDISQAIDRLHRIGQTQSVFAKVLIVAGTIEETMWEAVERKQKTIDRLLTEGEDHAS